MTIPTKPQPQAAGPNPSSDEALALPLLMKFDEVMRTLAISRRTVYELIKDGKLHLVRVGVRGSRIRTEEVLQLAGTNFRPLRIPRCVIRMKKRNPPHKAPNSQKPTGSTVGFVLSGLRPARIQQEGPRSPRSDFNALY
jgi:excisionase family DNA binding protein